LIKAPDEGLERDSIVKADQVRVLAKTRLLQMLGKLSEAKIAELNRALMIALDLPGQDDEES
jgi:mRNA interferase MazF